jgi:DNA replication protein DnaD
MEWFRFYTETISDRKIRRLPPAQRWLWVTVLSIARSSPEPGKLLLSKDVPVTIDDLVDSAAITKKDVVAGVEAFVDQKMLHLDGEVYVVSHWDARQFTKDESKDRVRRYRQRKSNGDVTLQAPLQAPLQECYSNTFVTPPDPDTDPDTEKDQREREITHARAEIVQAYEQVCGPLRGEPAQLDNLLEYTELGMSTDLVIHAIRQSSTADRPAKYAGAILQSYQRKGIKTLDAANAASEGRNVSYGHSRDRPVDLPESVGQKFSTPGRYRPSTTGVPDLP